MSDVLVAVYDLSNGMATQFSQGLLGKQIDGIWHTGLICFGREYYFGGGICSDAPGTTPYGMPVRTEKLGTTSKTQEDFLAFLRSVQTRFSMSTYDLFENNCNNFSDACAMFLVGVHIPQYVLDLPNEALNSPLGPMLRQVMQSAQASIRDQSLGHEMNLGGNTAGSIVPTTSSSTNLPASKKTRTRQMWATPVTLTRSNRAAVVTKLKEFVPSMTGNENAEQLLKAVQSQSADIAFPTLDLIRLAALKSSDECVVVAKGVPQLTKQFCTNTGPSARAAFMMTMRAAVNCFAFTGGESALLDASQREAVFTAAADSIRHPHKAVRSAGAALILNIAGSHARRPKEVEALSFDDVTMLASALCEVLQPDTDELKDQAVKNVLQALAVIINEDDEALQLVQVFGASTQKYSANSALDAVTLDAAKFIDQKMKETR